MDQVEVVILDVAGCRYLQFYCWQPEGRRRLKLEQQWDGLSFINKKFRCDALIQWPTWQSGLLGGAEMNKWLSIVIAVESADAHDLAVPLSSINNQLGVDFRQIEVLLIDNGRYQLEDLEPLRVFNHLKFRYIKPAKIWPWAMAFQQGLMLSTGKYVTFMGPNMQFNSVDILQQVFSKLSAQPESQLVSGLLLRQQMKSDRTYRYQVEPTAHLLSGRFVSRALIMQDQITFEDFGAYTEMYVGQLIEAVAQHTQTLESAITVQFLGRTVSDAVLAPMPDKVQLEWVTMMSSYLLRLRTLAPDRYRETLAKTVIRFYSQAGHDPAMTAQMAELTAQNATMWPDILAFVERVRTTDRTPTAPWNADASGFSAYLQRVSPLSARVSITV
ncbi:glycosyltransferase family A protein [Lacticaseibacillus hegangensis]|uniref:Glycosyltransferase family A protein n=1 Tax=Lacticaseibacillus hegangensis TaxID=2486010 RepID=A0ABW4CXU1_9LACO